MDQLNKNVYNYNDDELEEFKSEFIKYAFEDKKTVEDRKNNYLRYVIKKYRYEIKYGTNYRELIQYKWNIRALLREISALKQKNDETLVCKIIKWIKGL